MMGRRLEVASGGRMKLKDGLEVWRKCLQLGRRVRVKDMLVVARGIPLPPLMVLTTQRVSSL